MASGYSTEQWDRENECEWDREDVPGLSPGVKTTESGGRRFQHRRPRRSSMGGGKKIRSGVSQKPGEENVKQERVMHWVQYCGEAE